MTGANGTFPEDGLYHGTVRHFRLRPVRHRLAYRVYSFLMDVDRLDEYEGSLRYFSRNGFNLFSFGDRDHGPGTGAPVGPWLREQLKRAGLSPVGPIKALFYPRLFGYAFNPLTVYYCFSRHGDMTALVYAVRNTFGGRHVYLVPVGQDECRRPNFAHGTEKRLHVSPFVDMGMRYDFSINRPGARLALAIRVGDDQGPLLNTSFGGAHTPLTDEALRHCFFRYPLMSFKVVGAIHWEAVKLLLKGLRLRSGGPDPENPVTVVTSANFAEPLANHAQPAE